LLGFIQTTDWHPDYSGIAREHPRLTDGLDLRYKVHWLSILEQVRTLKQTPDISLEDLERSEQMLKDSLFKVGTLAGRSQDELEIIGIGFN
jgi:hypothetical protein